MTRPFDKHLDGDELDGIIRSTGLSQDSGSIAEEVFPDARLHASSCQECRRKIEIGQQVQDDIFRLQGPRLPAASKCQKDADWLMVAAGLLSDETTRDLIAHAASCEYCGPQLKRASAIITEEVSTEEEGRLAGLKSSTPEWKRALTYELAGIVHRRAPETRFELRPVFKLSSPIVYVLAFLILVAAVLGVLNYRKRANEIASVQSLIAAAYTEQRTVVLRVPGAAYGAFRVSRGNANTSRLDRPAALLEAEAEIAAKQTQGRRTSTEWLKLRAQVDLLEWNYNAAIQTLHEAEAIGAGSSPSDVYLYLAMAYFERAEANNYAPDYGTAVEFLGRVLDKNPNDPVALFNRAIVYEKLALYSQSASDWKRYLELDRTGEWSQEARQHLADLQQRIKQHHDPQKNVLLSPGKIAESSVSDTEIDRKIEELQASILVQWLPDYLVDGSSAPQVQKANLRSAIRRVSRLTQVKHQDSLLQDIQASVLLTRSTAPVSITDLAKAILANQSGDEHTALVFSRRAEQEFKRTGSMAGLLRAEFEEVYALQFSFRPAECRRLANDVARASHQRSYHWLEAQSLIEEAFCANMEGDLQFAKGVLHSAFGIAKDANYEDTLERVMVGNAALEWQTGSSSRAWAGAVEGLNRYWAAGSSDIRGISFYDLLDLIAEETQQWRLQEAVLKEALLLVDRQKDPLVSAQTRYRLACSELMLHKNDAAHVMLEDAARLFKTSPNTQSTIAQETIVNISLAKAELQNGDLEQSLQRLNSILPRMKSVRENLSALDFYSTLGEVYRHLGKTDESEIATGKAIAIFHHSLASLIDPRDRLSWYHEGSSAYRSLIQLRIEKNDIQGAFDLWEAYRGSAVTNRHDLLSGDSSAESLPDQHGLASQLSVSNRGEHQGALRPEFKVISYARLPRGLFGWIRSGTEIYGTWLNEFDLDTRRILFQQLCSNPSSSLSDVTRLGHQLYGTLLRPFAKWIGPGEPISIQPDEELAALPFAGLLDDSAHFIGITHNIVILSTVLSQQKRQHHFTFRDPALFVIAGSVPNSAIDDPFAQREVRTIASLFLKPAVLDPQNSSSPDFLKLLSEAVIFHYAGHSLSSVKGGGLFIGLSSKSSEILHGRLDAQDVGYRLLTRCRLAVMSACNTDQGQDGHWFDRDNLALTFLNAGVQDVVASNWEVDSDATSELMKQFYSQLLQGSTVSNALRLAAEHVRESPRTAHPYYWAGFSVLEN